MCVWSSLLLLSPELSFYLPLGRAHLLVCRLVTFSACSEFYAPYSTRTVRFARMDIIYTQTASHLSLTEPWKLVFTDFILKVPKLEFRRSHLSSVLGHHFRASWVRQAQATFTLGTVFFWSTKMCRKVLNQTGQTHSIPQQPSTRKLSSPGFHFLYNKLNDTN